ncbi:hypothetical protein [Sphingomonas prati]|uniref:Uncharacterized protein n=1 Tax=Sphingomonas prati TaxID=1843237 RepID=A0A7W9BQZ3_9SPHN|nr:hypothetical protein [Sphingomonas prati]MBB5728504.1 hypothetical protein [Sphingomonas prati]GGE73267.1 hypothetical protein GCM10011404_02230 [Sphingomonas prati]
MSAWLSLVLQTAVPFDLAAVAKPVDLSAIQQCGAASSGEIVVCGGRSEQYRLPLPNERVAGARTRGDAPTGTAALTPPAPCGIFAGERRCGKREAADYGYSGGRDPITALTRVVTGLVDPDAN